MKESPTPTTRHFTGCASLAAVGLKLRELDLFGPIRNKVQIKQKTVKDMPIDKLYDGFISVLAGAHGLVEIPRVAQRAAPFSELVEDHVWWAIPSMTSEPRVLRL